MRHRWKETGFLLLPLDEAMLAVEHSGVPSSTFTLTTTQREGEPERECEGEGDTKKESVSRRDTNSCWLHESDAAVIVAWPLSLALSLAFCTDYGNWRCKQCENEKLDAIAKVM